MIHLSSNAAKNLEIILPNTNKALALALKNATHKQLQNLTQTKDLSGILNNILKQSSTTDEMQNRALLELLKNNPTLKSLSNAVPNIKALLTLVKDDKNFSALERTLQNFMTNIKDIDSKELHKKFQSSGLFLENELKKSPNPKEILSSDLKALLLKTEEQLSNAVTTPKADEMLKQIDKLTLQIDYYQLLSHLSNGSSLYIPYSWDALQEGNINIKKMKNKNYCCDIHLNLKEYGELDLRLILTNERQLTITMTSQSKELKEIILQNMQILKKQLSNAALVTKDIRFIDKQENFYDDRVLDSLAMGFEVKV
jgi:hypothetical protein